MLVNEHIQFDEEHQQLLRAQIILYDTFQKLTEAQTQLAAAQQHSDEKLAALVGVVDSLVRRPPPGSLT